MGILQFALTAPGVTGVLNATAPVGATNAEYTRAFAAALHRPAFLTSAPRAPALPLGGGCVSPHRPAPPPPMTAPAWALRALFGDERAAMLLTGARVAPARTQALGYKFAFPDIDRCMRNILA